MKISEMVMDRLNYDYFLPSIQREFVWRENRKDKKIEKLFDSILQGYPIGYILVWKLNKGMKEKLKWETYEFIKDYDDDRPHNKENDLEGCTQPNLVLDGQQRLSALLIGLKGSCSYSAYQKKRKTKLYINLFSSIDQDVDNTYGYKYEIEFLEEDDNDGDKYWFKIGKVLDYREKKCEDFKEAFEDEIRKRAKGNTELMKKAKHTLGDIHAAFCGDLNAIKITEESSSDDERILNIFVRTNAAGTPLEKADILLSYMEANKELFRPHGARSEIFSFVDDLNKERVNLPNYGFEKDEILKACLVLSDLDVQYRLNNFNKENLKKINAEWKKIKQCMGLTRNLLGRYHFTKRNIVSKNALLPIAYYLKYKNYGKVFIHSSEQICIDEKNTIMRWLVISTFKGAFGSSSDSILMRMRESIKNGKRFDQMIEGQELTRDDIEKLVQKEGHQSRYAHLILMLISNTVYWDNCHEDHMYARSKFDEDFLKDKIGLSDTTIGLYMDKADSIANLCLLNPSVNISKSADDFYDWSDKQNSLFLNDLLIPKMKDYGWKHFLTFVKERENLIIDKLAKLLNVKL